MHDKIFTEKVERMVGIYKEHTEEGYTDRHGVLKLLTVIEEVEGTDDKLSLMGQFEEEVHQL